MSPSRLKQGGMHWHNTGASKLAVPQICTTSDQPDDFGTGYLTTPTLDICQ